mgnify:CR=1 FL=1
MKTLDLSPYKNVLRWIEQMRQVPLHDDVHVVLQSLGPMDVKSPEMKAIGAANKASVAAVDAILSGIRGAGGAKL